MRDFTREEIERHAVAASSLVRELAGGDDDLAHDLVEGETDLFEAIERALDEITECEIMQAGISDAVKKLNDRKGRAKKRADRLRGLIDQAFQMAEVKSHTFPSATITTKNVPPKLMVTDESAIPSIFFVPQPLKLDLDALKKAAVAGKISGAEMSNGGTTIQIRRA